MTEVANGVTAPSFDAVFVAERDALLRVAYLVVGTEAIAEEVVQDAFAELYQRFDRIDNAPAYVRTTVVRMAVRARRRRAMEITRLQSLREPEATGDVAVDTTWDALARLSPERRAVLVLRFYDDLTHGQIAALLGWREATVRTRLHRGLADLRKELER
jgi:RNA polymerase sigma factor (sigma-70 family)